jgi:drug/metabolite transporter (DMT)-like permease
MRCLLHPLFKPKNICKAMTNTVLKRSTGRLGGIFCALIAVLLWATVGVVYKLTLSRLDGFVVTLYVEIIATLILGINIVIRRKVNVLLREFRRDPWFFCIAGIVGNGMQQIFYLKGFQFLPTTQVVMLFYIYPLLMLIITAIGFHERLSARSWMLTLTGMGGMVLAIAANQPLQIVWNGGIFAPLLAACTWALFSVFIKHKTFDSDCGISCSICLVLYF